MKRLVLFLSASALIGQAVAAPIINNEQPEEFKQEEIPALSVTYLDHVYANNGWDANWFATLQIGKSAFLGKPVGCGDLFDRTKPVISAAIGKWISPTVGLRVAFQGMEFIDANSVTRKYQNFHGDVMYNVSNALRENNDFLNKWDIIPYLGIGLVHNNFTDGRPFGITLGIAGRYRITDRLHISAEVGNTFTAQNMDGLGADRILGDNLLQASIGLTVTLGKNGWRPVIDAKPYIYQNDQLRNMLENANGKIHRLDILRERYAASLAEMRKILEIEGLLDKYELDIPEEEVRKFPKNNYSGINSLRARLRNKGMNNDEGLVPDTAAAIVTTNSVYEPLAWNSGDTTQLEKPEYFTLMKDGRIFVGTPVFFFFKLGTTELNEKAQIINLKEIANVIKRYGLSARVVGAADSQTGSAYTNEKLSKNRAKYICDLLENEGVPADRLEQQFRGGINTYVPMHGNRNTCVLLYFK